MSSRQDFHPRDLLSPYLDGELENDARTAVEVHLAACASCRSLLKDFRAMATAAAREAPPPVPVDLGARIRRAIDSQEASGGAPRGRSFWSYRLGLAAAASAVLVIGLWALRQEPAPTSIVSDNLGDLDRPPIETGAASPSGAPLRPGETMGSLRSLGYGGGESQSKSEPPPPPPASNRMMSRKAPRLRQIPAPGSAPPQDERGTPLARPAVEADDLAASSGEPAAAAPAAGTPGPGAGREETMTVREGFVQMKGPREAMTPWSGMAVATPGRSLVFEYPDHRVSVSEDGTVALSAEKYACSARLDGPSVDPDITALFALASSPGVEAPGAPGATPRSVPVVRLAEPQAASGRAAHGAAAPLLSAEKAIEIEKRLRALLRDRYLALVEGRCGPAPRNVHTP